MNRARVTKEVESLATAATVLLALLTFAGPLDVLDPFLDVLRNFRPHYALLAIIPTVYFAVQRRWVAGIAAAVIASNLVFIAPWLDRRDSSDGEFRVTALNAFGEGGEPVAAAREVLSHRSNIVFTSELAPAMRSELSSHFEHEAWHPEAPNLGLFTEFPVASSAARWVGGRYLLDATLDTPRGQLRVIGVHTMTPWDSADTAVRNEALRTYRALATESDLPLVFLGDFNTSMYSPRLAPLTDAGLTNAREGRGLLATWPAQLPVRVPIDHIFVSRQFKTRSVDVGAPFGSDHLPLHASFDWAP